MVPGPLVKKLLSRNLVLRYHINQLSDQWFRERE
jgi:hypothetical protein